MTAAGRPLPPNLETLTSDPVKSKARFLEALKEISALNAASGPSLAYGVTPFAHMTKDEFRRHYLSGLAPLGPRGAKQPPGAGRRARILTHDIARLPAHVFRARHRVACNRTRLARAVSGRAARARAPPNTPLNARARSRSPGARAAGGAGSSPGQCGSSNA